MDCSHAQSLLDTYLDQELDPVRNLEIEEHLQGCAASETGHSASSSTTIAIRCASLEA